jgi:hypothetical protein
MFRGSLRIKIACCLALSLSAACSDNPQQQLKQVIVEYNRAVIAAYQSGTAKGLINCAAEKEVNKVQVLIDVKSGNGLVLESELQNIELLSFTAISPDDYKVRTKERWKYFDRALKAGSTGGSIFIADMYLEYSIRKDHNKWKVMSVKAENTEYLQPKPVQKQ